MWLVDAIVGVLERLAPLRWEENTEVSARGGGNPRLKCVGVRVWPSLERC